MFIKLQIKFISLIFRHAGFTLVELLVVISLTGILAASSVSIFSSYTKAQTYQSSVSDVVALLTKARQRAFTQVKPPQCGAQVLKTYQVYIVAPGSAYRFRVSCGASLFTLEDKTLPANVTFTNSAPISVDFAVTTGTVRWPKSITISGNGITKIITVDSSGIISVQ